MRARYILFLVPLLVLSGCTALYGPTLSERAAKSEALFNQAQDAVAGTEDKQPDYAGAARYYERAARNGSAEGAYALAALYRDSLLEEERDFPARERAFFWMREAAVGGWTQAQYELAVFYYEGKGTERDPEQALAWVERAAENNHVLAQRFLGALYLNGSNAESEITVNPDVKKGAAWYLRAAYNGDAPSQAVMGSLYMTGKGVEKDSVQAIKWNRLAAGKGMAGAQKRLSTLYADQKRRSTYEQAILLNREDFAKGDAQAGYNLGRIYYYAPSPYANPRQAVKLFEATSGKVGASALMLGVAFEEGKGVAQDFAQAVTWYKRAVGMGQHEACAYLGAAYLDGRGAPADEAGAVAMFRTGAEKGDPRSQRHLAILYTQGRGVPYDYEQALHWSLEAAKGGDVQAMYLVGVMYEKGVGTSRDVAEAQRWYQRVAGYVGDGFVREESAASWKRNAQKALSRLEEEAAAAAAAAEEAGIGVEDGAAAENAEAAPGTASPEAAAK